MDRRDQPHIPQLLQGAIYYVLDTDAGYLDLHRRLTNQNSRRFRQTAESPIDTSGRHGGVGT